MKRILLLALIVLSGVGAAIFWFFPASGEAQDDTALTGTVRRGSLTETVKAIGFLEPSRLVNVGAQVTGQLTAIHVALGDKVLAGDLIAEIASLQQQNELRLARASLSEAQATQRSRQYQLDKVERALKRQQELYSGQAGSGADLQDAQSAVRMAIADLDLSAAQIEKATVEVEKAETNLGYTRITAPMDGQVISLPVKSGQTLNAVQTTPIIAIIARTDIMTVNVQVSEADVGRVKTGQTVHFTTFADRTTKHESKIREVQPAPSSILSREDSTRSDSSEVASAKAVYYNVLFDAPNPDGRLLSMMTAEVAITVGTAENILLAPSGALSGPDEDGFHTATVKHSKGVTEVKGIRIGLTDRIQAEIVEGLSEGDELLLQADKGPTDTDVMLE